MLRAVRISRSTKTLSINWEDPHPRVLWDGGAPIGEDRAAFPAATVSVCPCNALMEKHMLGEAGSLHIAPRKPALDGMIDIIKGIEPEIGYGSILKLSEMEAAMRESHIKQTKTVCTYCGVGCSFDVWTKDRQILKRSGTPARGGQRRLHLHEGQRFGWDLM